MLGILGGTFDPVHYGHLEPAREVMRDLALEKVLFVPNHIPPHRRQPRLPAAQRVELLQLALAGYPGFELDLRELERGGPSYMIDTLVSLQQNHAGRRLCLILGMDAFLGIDRWHRWRELFDHCHMVVTARPGFEPAADMDASIRRRLVADADGLSSASNGKILVKSYTLLDISASEIRRRIQSGESAGSLMPPAVYAKYREIMAIHADR